MARTDTLNNFLTDIADSIRSVKNTTDSIKASDFDTEIKSIESSGGSLGLWCGGNNPVLIASAKEVVNIANDTTYSSITPTTSAQSIKEKSTLAVVNNIDLENYDYVIVQKTISVISYIDAPSDIKLTKNKVNQIIYNLGDIYVNSLTTKTGYVKTLLSETGVLYQNGSSGDTYSSYGSGGIGVSSSNTPYYYKYGSQLTIYTSPISASINSTFMQEEAFNYVDAENSNVTFIAEVYRIDKKSPCAQLNNEVIEALVRGSFDE